MGVARDLAAGLGVAFEPPDWSTTASGPDISEAVDVEIVDPTLCGRFVGRVLRHAPAGSSPPWMANRLTALGQRPINSIVDISNYVMLELGQPSHTFDLGRVSGAQIRVRRAGDGETIVTLDGQHRILASGDGVIADGDDGVIGIAGVMGGASTEIDADTTDVLVEMAWWDPPSISRTAKRLNLSSEAATRFRRGADWGYNVERCMNRFVQLAVEQGAEVAPGMIDERGDLPDRRPLRVRTSRVNTLLGTSLSAEAMAGHLGSIGFGADMSDDGAGIDVTIPTWRWDTETETDVAEESPASTDTRTSSAPFPPPTRRAGCRPIRRIAAWCARCWWARVAVRRSRCRSWRRGRWLRWVWPRTASPCPTPSTTASRC